MYKITNDRIIHKNDEDMDIPRNPDNRHYQQFLRDVKEQGIDIVEGPEVVVRVDYKEKRLQAYPDIGDQLDKIYHHGIDAWKADIKMIKDQFPDSQVGLSTTANVPDWVQTEVDKLE
jgi:hypothetical protein